MRLRFLDMAGARCASTVGLSSGAVLGDGLVVRGRGARGRPGLPADSHASRWRERGGTSSACARSLRGSDTLLGVRSAARGMVLSRRRAPRALPTEGERMCLKLCARARFLAIVGRLEMSTAQVNGRIR